MEMPSDVVKALRADGWWLRTRIPWLKRNAMPESTGDRPTQAVEYVFLLTKSGTPQFWTHRDKDGTDKKPKADYRWMNQVTEEEVTVAPPDWKEIITCPNCSGTGIADIEFEYDVMGETFLDTQRGECPVCKGEKKVQRWKRINLWRGHDYFYDGEAVRVKQKPITVGGKPKKIKEGSLKKGIVWSPSDIKYHPSGRSRRNSDWFFESWQGLWTDENGEPLAFIVNPKAYGRAHFATFPPGLVIPCIKAGTSEKGCCPECGNPWVRIVETKHINKSGWGKQGLRPEDIKNRGKYSEATASDGDRKRIGYDVRLGPAVESKTLGWRPTCSCGKDKEPVPCVVLDFFAGSGTTIEVARKMGRDAFGFDINPDYVVVTDPIWNVGKDYGEYKDNLSQKEYGDLIIKLKKEWSRVANGKVAIVLGSEILKTWWDIWEEAKIIIVKLGAIVLTRKNNMHLQWKAILSTCLSNEFSTDLWEDIRWPGEGYFFNEPRYGHPAMTPLKLMKRLIYLFSKEGDLILDTYMGVGTTAVAAKQLGRRFIGFEINPKYVDIANQRLSQEMLKL